MSTLAAGMLRNRTEAEDVVEEALVRIHRAGQAFRGERGVRTWVLRIVANLCRDRLRRRRFDGGSFDEESVQARVALVADPASGWDARIDRDRLAASLDRALAELPPDLREAVLLRHRVGLAHEDMVEVLGIPLGTVKSRIARGLAGLRPKLGGWS